MKLDKNYKVRVTPEQSREIQELVFGLGGKWNGGTDWVINEIIPFLYVTSGLVMTCGSREQEYFGYPSSENTEIQADDLIALLTDLSKSAENPLQNMKLTPEFEAVVPHVSEFKAGDPVYWGLKSKIFKIHRFMSTNVLEVELDGGVTSVHKDELCPATQENHKMLCKLFPSIEFERPPLTGNELCRKLLNKGEKYIMAKDDTDTWRIICDYCDDWFTDVVSGKCLKNVTPVNSKGEPLTEAVLDE